jgi:integral membrane protein
MKEKNILLRRYVGMILGVLIISVGIALFKESHLGNDPISALNMRLAEIFGISLGLQNLYANIIFLIIQIFFGRKYIGAGTFANGILVGYAVSFIYGILVKNFGYAEQYGIIVQIAWALIAVVVTSLGVSLYQTADLGVAPYDYLSLGLRDKTKKHYYGCRMFTDGIAALATYLLGGLVGLGTLLSALCLGPIIHFFDVHISEKFIGYTPQSEKEEEQRDSSK